MYKEYMCVIGKLGALYSVSLAAPFPDVPFNGRLNQIVCAVLWCAIADFGAPADVLRRAIYVLQCNMES